MSNRDAIHEYIHRLRLSVQADLGISMEAANQDPAKYRAVCEETARRMEADPALPRRARRTWARKMRTGKSDVIIRSERLRPEHVI